MVLAKLREVVYSKCYLHFTKEKVQQLNYYVKVLELGSNPDLLNPEFTLLTNIPGHVLLH